MPKLNAILSIMILCIIVPTGIIGCSSTPQVPESEFVIKAGTITVTPMEFLEELDLKLTGYPYDIKTNKDEYNAMILDLVSTLSDETVLLAAAAGKGISISAQELDQAETEFKKDYPEDSFDQMLLETAISYPVWKNRMKKDMVIRKLIQQDLVDVQEISAEDMISFYKQFDKKTGDASATVKGLDEKSLVDQLRMEKSQGAFEGWIKDLKAAYPVEIDEKAVAVFLINRE
ncbi:MAG: SurA N-terminal domain-containing protein [Desulfobacterales bacterium]|nr:SurA N-terminal domain-containing protein [Desulfobacterales bacterium]